ncbi:putative trap dicarboxylate transporter, dctp subunit [Roseibium sp. TrichSKD4]|nr:putative trap dicarboxylate transporter, dctp subunit [Roseibium sp. TrichSKD4]
MLKKLKNLMMAGAGVAALGLAVVAMPSDASADGHAKTKLRIQTHFSTETLSGQMAQEFIDDVTAMSNGEIEIEMFFASSVVKSAETFDAAATGILDCDMTGGAYQTGKNPAFQFAGDLTGGYQNPYQQYAWLLHGGGYDRLNELYMQQHGVYWLVDPGPESLSSTKSFTGVADLKGWKSVAPASSQISSRSSARLQS